MLYDIIGDKPWINSLTMIAVVILSAGEAYGLSDLPAADVVAHITRVLTGVFGMLGLRKASQRATDTAEAALDAVLDIDYDEE